MIETNNFNYWIFDLDGTLTRAKHDFPRIKKSLGLPTDRGILEVLAEMEEKQARLLSEKLDAIEWEIACTAEAAAGVPVFLATLKARGASMGILTRNKKTHAVETLRVTGLLPFFDQDRILGRDEAEPKPSPEGVLKHLAYWGAAPHQTALAGDFRFDLEAGRAAGVTVIYVDPTGCFPFRHLADRAVVRLDELL